MREVVDVLVRALVDNPDAVTVTEEDRRGRTVFLRVNVGPGDMGKVIGRQGRIANAIRQVASGVAAHDDLRVVVDFSD
ncbi:MAG: KH domain-containing protein [Armatimonadota bacterium]